MCYSYSADKISRISLWKEGKEVALLKQFSSNIMTEYKNGHKIYEGEFLNEIRMCYPRNGKGEEYDKDGESMIFQGNYKNGKRHGKGIEYDNGVAKKEREWIMGHRMEEIWIIQSIMMILVIVFIIISFNVQVVIGSILLGVLLLYFVSLWKCQEWLSERVCIFFDFDDSINSFIERFLTVDKRSKTCKSKYKKVMRNNILENCYLCMIVILVIVIIIFIIYSIIDYYYGGPHGIKNKQESYIVGNGYGNQFKRFKISNYPNLKTIKIGNNSFTQRKNGYGYDKSKSFHILNCESLESIQIGEFSFSDFAGDFELKNLPKLQSIQIGSIGRYSYNFFWSSFVIRGIDMILSIE